MKHRLHLFIAFILLVLFSNASRAQEFRMYTADSLTLNSVWHKRALNIQTFIPNSLSRASSSASYPLILLFDQQNQTTFRYNLESINFLTGVGGQIPACIVAGVPFDPMERMALTSSDIAEGDSISGLRKTERMVFEELIPQLKKQYPQIGSVILIGHSRTGWLVNYLVPKHADELLGAASCSGFFEDTESQMAFMRLGKRYTRKAGLPPLRYYMTAGTGWEEETYRKDFEAMGAGLSKLRSGLGFQWKYITLENANHITNYGLSVPQVLNDLFREFPELLGEWFETHTKTIAPENAFELFSAQWDSIAGTAYHPSPGHLYSLASHYFNEGQYEAALDFLNEGVKIFPKDAEFRLFRAETLKLAGQTKEFEREMNEMPELFDARFKWTEAELNDLKAYWEELKE